MEGGFPDRTDGVRARCGGVWLRVISVTLLPIKQNGKVSWENKCSAKSNITGMERCGTRLEHPFLLWRATKSDLLQQLT